MPDEKPCTPTTERSDVSAWQYIGASPINVIGGASAGGVGASVSDAIYVWQRTFSLKYKCECNGKTADVIVPGNVEYYTQQSHLSGFTAISLSPGVPLPGVLGAIADALGASIDIAHWFADPGQAAGEKPADPTSDTPANGIRSKLQPVPIAMCGRRILFGTGDSIAWPAPGAPPPPPPDLRIELDCPTAQPKSVDGVSFGFASGDKDTVETDALRDAMRNAYSAMEREASGYKCKGGCKLIAEKTYKDPTIFAMWPTHSMADGDRFIAQAKEEWVLILSCQSQG